MSNIIYPVCLLVMWTMSISLYVLYTRVSSALAGKINPVYFRLLQGSDVPEAVIKSTRHWANLFEAPVLFYLVCVLIIITGIGSNWFTGLAWCYVVARVVHSLIHLGYNHVMHRLYAFTVSQIVLLTMWIMLIIQVK